VRDALALIGGQRQRLFQNPRKRGPDAGCTSAVTKIRARRTTGISSPNQLPSLRLAAGLALLACLGLSCSRARNSPVSQATIPRSEPPAAAGALAQPTAMPNPLNPQYPGIAVVELFTSEGCSSCPSADATLARVAERAERAGRNIFPVELHVDYWDYLGWRDPFDDARYSERQATYRALSGSTYTPQAVVNGVSDCVGSNEARLSSLIEAELAKPATTQLQLSARFSAAGVQAHYQIDASEPAQTLALIVVEARRESAVLRGENAGERLAHRNVARAFATRPLAPGHGAGDWELALPAGFVRDGARVLAFAEGAHGGITGAALVGIAPG